MRNSVTRNCEGWNRNAENQCGFAGNLGGNLGIAAEMTQNSENDKLKECREVKIIENEYICKNLVSRI